MSTIKSDGPVGWLMDRQPNNAEAKQISASWISDNYTILDVLVDTLRQAAESGDGNSLCLWLTTLRGLANDIENILTRKPVVALPVAMNRFHHSGS